jgi:hypothetical protein
MKRFDPLSLSRRAALLALFAAVCNAQTGASGNWGAAASAKDLFVKADQVDKNAPRSILLIGENHASVKTQTQLAALLEMLYADRAVDAILVEGSNGKIDSSDLRSSLANRNAKQTADFWKGQLQLGQIAGYEYIALTRDGVRTWGIEDMEAKRNYTVDAAKRGALAVMQEEIEMHQRGLTLASSALIGVAQTARQQSRVDAALSAYQSKIDDLKRFKERDGAHYADAEAQYTDSVDRITALFAKVKPVLPAYDNLVKE